MLVDSAGQHVTLGDGRGEQCRWVAKDGLPVDATVWRRPQAGFFGETTLKEYRVLDGAGLPLSRWCQRRRDAVQCARSNARDLELSRNEVSALVVAMAEVQKDGEAYAVASSWSARRLAENLYSLSVGSEGEITFNPNPVGFVPVAAEANRELMHLGIRLGAICEASEGWVVEVGRIGNSGWLWVMP